MCFYVINAYYLCPAINNLLELCCKPTVLHLPDWLSFESIQQHVGSLILAGIQLQLFTNPIHDVHLWIPLLSPQFFFQVLDIENQFTLQIESLFGCMIININQFIITLSSSVFGRTFFSKSCETTRGLLLATSLYLHRIFYHFLLCFDP